MKMNHRFILSLLVAPAVLGLNCWNAQAAEVANPFSVRLGAGYLSDGDTREALGSTHVTGGVSYEFSPKNRVDLDYIKASEDGDKVQSFGLTYLRLFDFNKKSDSELTKLYAGLGLGLFRVSARAEGNDNDGPKGGGEEPPPETILALTSLGGNSNDGFNETKTRLGGKALIGYNFSEQFFTEAAYTRVGKVEGADASNFSLMFGFHF